MLMAYIYAKFFSKKSSEVVVVSQRGRILVFFLLTLRCILVA